ncbi:MAG TPA: cytochrome d ubiquinol oxidase subunit II [Longimicrobiales bacterium]|nr:cytochrome d ubiquinol oxidase subunit II [Longimicrobiales bacterium]
MSVETILALVILASLIFYAVSGGADFGGGVWDLLAFGPRAERQRQAISDAIGPIWEANHVWLILVIVVVFTAFPAAFAIIMTALYVPLMLVLFGIVLRASAFVFRKYASADAATYRKWSAVFGASSLLTPFLLGLSLGALASGEIRVVDGLLTTGFLAGWTGAFAIGCGIFAQALFAFLAATYMTVETEGDDALQSDFRIRALASGLSLAPIALAVFLLARTGATAIFDALTGAWAPPLLIATSIAAIGALWSLATGRYRVARIAAIAQVTFIIAGWGLGQYPWLIVPDVTFADAAGPPRTLRMLVWALAIGALLLFPSFAYLFRVFRPGAGGRPDRTDA